MFLWKESLFLYEESVIYTGDNLRFDSCKPRSRPISIPASNYSIACQRLNVLRRSWDWHHVQTRSVVDFQNKHPRNDVLLCGCRCQHLQRWSSEKVNWRLRKAEVMEVSECDVVKWLKGQMWTWLEDWRSSGLRQIDTDEVERPQCIWMIYWWWGWIWTRLLQLDQWSDGRM